MLPNGLLNFAVNTPLPNYSYTTNSLMDINKNKHLGLKMALRFDTRVSIQD